MFNHLRYALIFTLMISFISLTLARPVRADGCFDLTSQGTAYTQNFDTLATTGTTNATSTLPLGWTLTESGGGARDNEQYGADDGGSATGDAYSYGVSGINERAFGGLQSGTLVPIIGACFTNNTGSPITDLTIAYTGEQWRLGTTGRPDRLDFQYSVNATDLSTGTWTDVNSLDFTAPTTSGTVGALNGNTGVNQAAPSATISSLNIANGANFWLRWNDSNASGADDGLAVDAFSLTASTTPALTATKTYTLAVDADSDTQADPGDVLSYTIVVSNSGGLATSLTFSDTLDPNLSQLGLVSISPIAFDDRYNTITNPVTLSITPTNGLFTNDFPGLNPAVSGLSSFGGGSLGGNVTSNLAGSTVPIASGGSLTLNADGSFSFTPAVGFQGVFTTFYRLQNFVGPGDGLVSFIVDAAPRISSTSPISAATLVNASTNITLTFTENVDIGGGAIGLNCGAGSVGFTTTPPLSATGTSTIVLDPTSNLPGLATCTVTVLAAFATDTDTNDPPNQLDGNGDGIEGDNYAFSFQVAPTANDDSYNVTPHLTFNSTGAATPTVRANDDPTTVTITGFGPTLPTANGTVPNGVNSITTGLGGTVILNPDGTFTFNPPPNQRNVNDAFFYTITGGDTATVTLAIQNQNLIWFVDASASAGGNGTQARPFNLLTGAGSFNTVASDNSGDFIFIADGGYSCGLTLLNSQSVIGDGSSSNLQTISGVTPVAGSTLPAFSGADPILSNPGGDCLTLAPGNTIRGLTIGDTSASGSDLSGSNFGALTVTETTLNGTGRALNLLTGTVAITLDGLTSTSGANNVNLQNTTGTASLAGGAMSGATGTAFNISGGTVSATYSGSISQANNAALVSVSGGHNTGTLTFQTGTLNASSGTGLQFDNADGTYTFNGTTTLNGGDAGVDIINGSGGTFTFGTGINVTNPSGIAYREDASTANVTYGGAITKNNNANQAVDINAKSGGTTAFNGAILASTTTANAVDLTNTGGTVNFTGGLNLTTTSGVGFNATGGGTVSATQNNSTIVNTIVSGSGTALNVANTTIGASGLTFRSISANGAANGIVLNTTGASGGLTVTGTGSAGSGGTIQNSTNDGVLLVSTERLSLNYMNITGNLDNGIGGSGVNGFVLSNCSITNNGNSAATDDSGVDITNLTGTASGGTHPTSITNSTISNNFEFELQITNNTGTLADLQMSGNTISSNGFQPNHGNLVNFLGGGTSNMTLTVTSGNFTGNIDTSGGRIITADAIGAVNQGTSHTVNVSGATFTNNNVGVNVSSDPINTTLTFDIRNNIFTGGRSNQINSFHNGNPPFARTVNGEIQNNVIGTFGVANSGSTVGSGISVQNEGAVPVNILISGNTIQEIQSFPGVSVNVGLGGIATGGLATNITVINNTIRNIGSRAITIQDNQTTAPNFPTVCANISGNSFSGIAGQAGNGEFMRVRRLNGTFNVTQQTPTAGANAAELDDANGFNNPALINVSGTVNFNQPACPQP